MATKKGICKHCERFRLGRFYNSKFVCISCIRRYGMKICYFILFILSILPLVKGFDTTDTVANWHFDLTDINNGNYVDEVDGQQIRIYGGDNTTTGYIQESFLFDGTNDRLNATVANKYLVGESAWSILFRMNATTFPSAGNIDYIFSFIRHTDYYDMARLYFYNNGGSQDVWFNLGQETPTTYCQVKFTNQGAQFYNGAWHCVALIFNSTTCNDDTHSVWFDKTRLESGTITQSGTVTLANLNNLRIGVDQSTHYYAGKIDDFTIIHRELESSEIAEWCDLTDYAYPPAYLIVNTSLINNSIIDYTRINFTVNGIMNGLSNDVFTCSFAKDGYVQKSVMLNLTTNTHHNITFNITDWTTWHQLQVNCSDISVSASSTNYFYYLNLTLPVYEFNLSTIENDLNNINLKITELEKGYKMLMLFALWLFLYIMAFYYYYKERLIFLVLMFVTIGYDALMFQLFNKMGVNLAVTYNVIPAYNAFFISLYALIPLKLLFTFYKSRYLLNFKGVKM